LVFPRMVYPSGDFSIGLASLGAYLIKKGIDTSICDLTFNPNFTYLKKFLEEKKPRVVGIYSDTILFPYAITSAEIAKDTGASVVLGGPHPTILIDTCFESPSVDAVCIGEGEETMVEYIEKFGETNIDGMWIRKEGEIIKNPRRKPIEDLDSLPYPAVNLYDIERYIDSFIQLDSYNSNIRGVSIIASRGCPFSCAYCQPTLNEIFGRKVRIRSPENVLSELKEIKERYKIDGFFFQDDTMTIFKDWLLEFTDLMDKERLGLLFGMNTRADTVNYELLKILKDVGLVKIKIGIESVSDRIRNGIYNKNTTFEQIKDVLSWTKKLKIQATGYFMLGAPTETAKEVWQTIYFACNSSLIEANFSITTPLPKTKLYEFAKDKGYNLPEKFYDFDYYQVKRPKMAHHEIGINTLKISKKLANIMFYFYPNRVIQTLKSIFTKRGIKKLFIKIRRV